MERLNNCRICLQDDIPLRVIVGTHLQKMYESLTSMPLETKDLRSTLACYICCARLQNCFRLRVNCLQSEELFTQILSSNVIVSEKHKNSYKNTIGIAHPVVHLSIGDDFQPASYSDGDEVIGEEASGDVDDEEMMEDVQVLSYRNSSAFTSKSHILMAYNDEAAVADSDLGDNNNDGSIQYTNTQDLLDIVKEELCDVRTEAEDSDLGENSNNVSIQYTNTQDLLDIVKEELVGTPEIEDIVEDKKILSLHSEDPLSMEDMKCELDEDGIRVPVPKKTRHILQKSLVNLEGNKKYEKEEIHKIEQLKSDTTIAHEFEPVAKNEYVKQTHDKVFHDINKLSESNRTSNHNVVTKILSEIEMRTDLSVSDISLKGLNQHICDISKKCFNARGTLYKHSRIHTGAMLYQCDVCRKCFRRKNDLGRHIRTHTGEKPYQCDLCKKCFARKSHLGSHIRTHTGEKPFQCHVCKIFLSRHSNLLIHIRTHTGEKPYQCDVCKKCFKIKRNLVSHIRTHTGEKPYQCHVCKKCFTLKGGLDIHIRSHTGEKPYQCHVCKKCFSVKGILKSHIRTHTGEKPYQCHVCKKCFTIKSGLDNHIRTHTGEKPYQCHVCKKCFSAIGTLHNHISIHTSEKPYRCDFCEKCFRRKFDLYRHVHTHTGEKP